MFQERNKFSLKNDLDYARLLLILVTIGGLIKMAGYDTLGNSFTITSGFFTIYLRLRFQFGILNSKRFSKGKPFTGKSCKYVYVGRNVDSILLILDDYVSIAWLTLLYAALCLASAFDGFALYTGFVSIAYFALVIVLMCMTSNYVRWQDAGFVHDSFERKCSVLPLVLGMVYLPFAENVWVAVAVTIIGAAVYCTAVSYYWSLLCQSVKGELEFYGGRPLTSEESAVECVITLESGEKYSWKKRLFYPVFKSNGDLIIYRCGKKTKFADREQISSIIVNGEEIEVL